MKKTHIALLSLCLALVSGAHAQDNDDWHHSDVRHISSIRCAETRALRLHLDQAADLT